MASTFDEILRKRADRAAATPSAVPAAPSGGAAGTKSFADILKERAARGTSAPSSTPKSGFSKVLAERALKNLYTVDYENIVKDITAFGKEAVADNQSITYDNATALRDKYASRASEITGKTAGMRQKIQKYEQQIGADATAELVKWLDSVDASVNNTARAFQRGHDHYSQWVSKEKYEEDVEFANLDMEELSGQIAFYEEAISLKDRYAQALEKEKSARTLGDSKMLAAAKGEQYTIEQRVRDLGLGKTANGYSITGYTKEQYEALLRPAKEKYDKKLAAQSATDYSSLDLQALSGSLAFHEQASELSKAWKKADQSVKAWENSPQGSQEWRWYVSAQAEKQKIEQQLRDMGLDPKEDYERKYKEILSNEKRDYKLADRAQTPRQLEQDAINEPDFAEKSQYNENLARTADGSWKSEAARYVAINAPYAALANFEEAQEQDSEVFFLTPDEKEVYNYYYATEGPEKADLYYDYIVETLSGRVARDEFKEYQGEFLKELWFGVEAGLDQFATGVKNLFNNEDEYIPVNSTQQLSGLIREDLEGTGELFGISFGQVAYDSVTTAANMAPALITAAAVSLINPFAGKVVGATLIGASAKGNAYQTALNSGYSKEEASNYSTLVGVSEAGLSYLLSGFKQSGGIVTGRLTELATNAVNSACAKLGIQVVGNMAGEFTEEALQEMLDPFFQNLALHTDNDWSDIDWNNVVYAGMLGAISAGVMEGGPSVAKLGVNKVYTWAHSEKGAYDFCVELRENGITSLDASELAVIQENLKQQGVAPEHAASITGYISRAVTGAEMSQLQRETLNNNIFIAIAMSDVVQKHGLSGENSAETMAAEQQKAQAIRQAVLESAARVDPTGGVQVNQELAQTVADAAVALNQKVQFAALDSELVQEGRAGMYDPATDTVVLNPNLTETDLLGYTMAHEMTHSAEGTRQLAALGKTVRRMVGESEWQRMVEETQAEYAAAGIPLSDDVAVEKEVLADWVGTNLFKDGFAQMIVEGDVSTGNWFVRVIDKIRRALGMKNSQSARNIANLERLFMQAIENKQGSRSGDGQYAVAPISDEVIAFYEDVLSMTDKNARSKRKKKLGMVSKTQAKLIRRIFNTELGIEIDLTGYELWIDGDGVDHIERRHGKNGKQDHTMASPNDIGKLPWVANNAEFGELVREDNGTPKRDAVYENADQSKAYQVRLGRRVGDHVYYIVECVPDSNKKRIYIKSAYKNKKSGKGQLLDLNSNESRQLTSETLVDGNATNTNVAQNAPGVNTQSMQEGADYSQNALLPPDRFTGELLVDKTPAGDAVQQSPSHGDAVTAPFAQGGLAARTAERAPMSEAQVMERALQLTAQGKTVASSTDVDGIIAELGDDVALRRLYNAEQAWKPTGTITIDGRVVDAVAYVDAYEQSLPDSSEALQEHIRQLNEERVAEIIQMEKEGTLEEYTPGGLKIDLQLFAAKRKWDLLQIAPAEGGKKASRFYENRVKGKDELHTEELREMLAGRDESYNPIGNQKTLDRANQKLRDPKYQAKLLKRLSNDSKHNLLNEVDLAAAQVLVKDAINEGNYDVAMDLDSAISRAGTRLGRAVQSLSIIARMTPEGTLRFAQKTLKAEADYVIGEGANESLDILADDIAGALNKLSRLKGAEVEAPTGINQQANATTTVPQFADEDVDVQIVEKEGTGQKITVEMSRENVVDALIKDLAATEGTYLTKEEIYDALWNVVEESTNIPEQVKRYVLKKIRKGDGSLAERLYQIYQKGDLSQVKVRRALEQALELPTLTNEDVQTVVEMATQVQNLAEEPVAQAEAMDELYDFMASKMAVNGLDRLQAWRKFSMLANLKTHIRNTVSNAAYVGVRKADDAVAMALERLFVRDPQKRAAQLGWSHTEHGRKIMPKLRERAELAAMEMQKRGAKYETGTGMLKNRRKFFGKSKAGEVLNKANDFNSRWLEKEDLWFFKPAYIDALGQMMTARKTTEITEEMHQRAMKRALDATFRAENAISEVLSNLKAFTNKNTTGKRLFGQAVDVVIPFHKTPANIAAQTALHSPLGLAKGAFDLWNATRGKGSVEVADAINTFAKGVTGTALYGVGILLGYLGYIKIGYGASEKERDKDELAGLQENALIIGDISISLDWLQPAAAPFISGASIGQSLAEDDLSLETVAGSLVEGADSMFELTMLQSLYDVFGGYDAGFTGSLVSVGENVLSQSIPTLVGQAARAIDPVQRETKGDNAFETALNQVMAKIPGLTYLLDPKLDVWGNEMYRTGADTAGSALLNVAQQLGIPANTKIGTGADDPISQEILRLYEQLDTNSVIPTTITRDEATDNNLDYVDANRLLGATNRKAVEDFITDQWPYQVQETLPNGKKRNVTKYYSEMTDDERRRVLSRIYENTKKMVKGEEEEKKSKSRQDRYFEDLFEEMQKEMSK